MLYDLNIPWSPSTKPEDLERTLRFAASLGYDVVALNHAVEAPIPSQIVNPIPLLTPPPSSYPQPQPGPTTRTTTTGLTTAAAAAASATSKSSPPIPTTLRRVTITTVDPSVNYRLPAYAAAYDLVALRPTTDKAFQAACLSVAEASLISLDMASPLGFYPHPRTAMAAVRRGVRFEICYAQALQLPLPSPSQHQHHHSGGGGGGGGGGQQRASFIANAMGIVRATRGRGIVVSSEARSALGLRAPADVVNLLAVWGLAADKGADAMAALPRGVVANEGLRRRAFRGVVDIVSPAERGPREAAGKGEDEEAAAAAAGEPGLKKQKQKQQAQKQKQKEQNGAQNAGRGAKDGRQQQQQQQQHTGQKRKPDEDGEAGGRTASAAAAGDDEQPQLTLSKRQAKKLKREAMQKDKATAS